ncbi:MAG: SpoIID/LytB domain-containing protein [Proteobacteria bacterium]|nr:SpoIID/LytB domain-containing protein [Pseudomonadota bacterium]
MLASASQATPVDEASQVMLSLGSNPIKSQSLVRVKVFPHDKDYKPQGLDLVRDQLTLRSERPCAIYKSASDKLSTGDLLRKESLIQIKAAELKAPIMIQCPGSYTLERQTGGQAPDFNYEARLYIRTVETNGHLELLAINILPMREYLRGVVPSEVYREWPMETLKTQAVAARTYAVYHMLFARRYEPQRLWDVDDTIQFQAFTGSSLHSERTDEAVSSTDGQILTYHGQVIQAYYHADSGGQTEEALSVWSQSVPFTVARPEALDLDLARTLWERSFSLQSLTDELHKIGSLEPERSVRNLVIPMVGRTPTGRVRSLAIIDQKGRYKSISINSFKRAVPGLPSHLFTLEWDRLAGHMLIKGLGNGHGVGMSQLGAAAFAAQRAWTYKQILDYYYVRTTLCSLDGSHGLVPDCTVESAKYAEKLTKSPAES